MYIYIYIYMHSMGLQPSILPIVQPQLNPSYRLLKPLNYIKDLEIGGGGGSGHL